MQIAQSHGGGVNEGAAVAVLVGIFVLSIAVGGLVGYFIGKTKGRSGLGFVLGAILGMFGWLIVALLPRTAASEAAHYQQVSSLMGASGASPGAVGFEPQTPARLTDQLIIIVASVVAGIVVIFWLVGAIGPYQVRLIPIAIVLAVQGLDGFTDLFRRFAPRSLGSVSGAISSLAALLLLPAGFVGGNAVLFKLIMSLAFLIAGGIELHSWISDPERRGGRIVAAAAAAALIAGLWVLTRDLFHISTNPNLPVVQTRAVLFPIALAAIARAQSAGHKGAKQVDFEVGES